MYLLIFRNVLLLLCTIFASGCGPSEEKINETIKITCNILSDTAQFQASIRVKEINAAREKLGMSPFLGRDQEIKEAIKYDLCEQLVRNSADYSRLLSLKKNAVCKYEAELSIQHCMATPVAQAALRADIFCEVGARYGAVNELNSCNTIDAVKEGCEAKAAMRDDICDTQHPLTGEALNLTLEEQSSIRKAFGSDDEEKSPDLSELMNEASKFWDSRIKLFSDGEAGLITTGMYVPPEYPLCSNLRFPLKCIRAGADGPEAIFSITPPFLLSLKNTSEMPETVLVISLEAKSARVLGRFGHLRVSTKFLLENWSGDYVYLGFDHGLYEDLHKHLPVSLGDTGDHIGELAQIFASIDNQTFPLTQSRFNENLAARVKLFQLAENIHPADGAIDDKTFSEMLLKVGGLRSLDAILNSTKPAKLDSF